MGVGKAETSKVRTEEGAGSVRPANGARSDVMKAVSARMACYCCAAVSVNIGPSCLLPRHSHDSLASRHGEVQYVSHPPPHQG
jgi:hypothetical protein